MKTTARDKWLLVVLPAILTGIAYIFFSGNPTGLALKAARIQEKTAHDALPPPGAVAAAQKTLQQFAEKLSAEKQRSAKLSAAKPQFAGASLDQRNDALRTLSQIVAAHQLSLVKSEKLEGAAGKNVPAGCSALCKRISEHFALQPPEFWRLKIEGSYQDMLDALRALDQSALFIVPVSIGMETNAASGELEWSLTVWI